MVSGRRVAVIADARLAALHGLAGAFRWGDGRTFAPDDSDSLTAWAPGTVIALGGTPPAGPWTEIAWGAPGDRRVCVDGGWRVAPLPASDSLTALRSRPGAAVVIAGGNEAERASAVEKLYARRVEARPVERLTFEALAAAAVVALIGPASGPLLDAAPAVLAAGRILVAPHAETTFGLQAWSDHLAYENEDEMVCAADMASTYPAAFEVVAAMGTLAADAHLASAVYGRLAVDAELELLGDAGGGAVEHPPPEDERADDDRGRDE